MEPMRLIASTLLTVLLVLLLLDSGTSKVNAMTWDMGWSALVTGGVFCDQCLKQEVFPFGLPLKGAKVSLQCYDASGSTVVASAEATTDFFGGYAVTFKGVSDLSDCKAFVTSSPDSSCSMDENGAQALVLKSKFFHDAVYVVDPLFYKPSQPRDFCPGQPFPKPPPFSFPPLPPAPDFNFPPLPPLPPFPWKEPSTCGFEVWQDSSYFCEWKNATPFQTTVGEMFGKAAEEKYGNISIYSALQSGDELLRQAVAVMMNAYTNEHFYLSPKKVKKQFIAALNGSDQVKWSTTWAFQQANSGYGKGKCMLSPCK